MCIALSFSGSGQIQRTKSLWLEIARPRPLRLNLTSIPSPVIQSSPSLIVSSGLRGLVRIFEDLYSLDLAQLSTLWRPNKGAVDA